MGLLAFLKTQFVVHLLIGFVFVVSGLVINAIQLCTLVLWPLNKQLYRRLNCRLAYSLWSREYRARGGAGRGWRHLCGMTRAPSAAPDRQGTWGGGRGRRRRQPREGPGALLPEPADGQGDLGPSAALGGTTGRPNTWPSRPRGRRCHWFRGTPET